MIIKVNLILFFSFFLFFQKGLIQGLTKSYPDFEKCEGHIEMSKTESEKEERKNDKEGSKK